jgi:transcriptional regulator with XRE-family HTH domain
MSNNLFLDCKTFCCKAKTMANNLRQLRKEAKLTLEEVAQRAGTSNQMVGMLERGDRQLTQRWLEKLAPALDVQPYQIITDAPQDSVPIVGFVGAGSEAHYYSEAQNGGEFVRSPASGDTSGVAVEIRGSSLGPALDGWVAYYNDVRTPPTAEMMRKLCIVGLEDDRVLVKLLYPGSALGRYNLHSNTAEPVIENVPIRWAALVTDLGRR